MFILIIFNLEHAIDPFERQLAQFWMSTGLLFVDNWVLYRKIYSLQDCLILQEGAQWLSDRWLDSRLKGRGFEPHRRHCVVSLSKNINPSLVLVQPRKTLPFITERLLMGRKESNQTNKQIILQEEFNSDTSLGQREADGQMKFNETGCHSMRVTRNKHHNQFHFDYSLHNPTFGNV